jgi:DNA-binding XRE family transcriptional regulator
MARNAAIVEAAAAGASQTELARKFGVSRQRISQIVAKASDEPADPA